MRMACRVTTRNIITWATTMNKTTAEILNDKALKELERLRNNPLDHQVGGGHYKQFKIQPVEFIHVNKIPFIEGNIIKYACRWREKGGKETLEKIKHYVDILIELESKTG